MIEATLPLRVDPLSPKWGDIQHISESGRTGVSHGYSEQSYCAFDTVLVGEAEYSDDDSADGVFTGGWPSLNSEMELTVGNLDIWTVAILAVKASMWTPPFKEYKPSG